MDQKQLKYNFKTDLVQVPLVTRHPSLFNSVAFFCVFFFSIQADKLNQDCNTTLS